MPHIQDHRSAHTKSPRADFRITYHGTITTITPLSDACREWLEGNVEIEPWQRFGPSIVVEPRYVEQLAEAMIEEGLAIEIDGLFEECAGAALSPDRRGTRTKLAALTKIATAVVLVLTLAGCGPDRRAAYQSQLEADHQACLRGTMRNACVAYKLDVEKCSVITGNPIAAGCY
ncbi:MAG TPA: hypothetical protein VFR68_07920 [Candidatus Dormibacteraeota bacterium]|nr:hypothetical protein [Candidatus Dormibacteraeota bacterium]